MKFVLALALLLGVLQVKAAIYGTDDRQDIRQVPWLRPQAMAIANAIGNNLILANADGTFRLEGAEKMAGSSGVFACEDERFGDQPIIGNCTGFLVADRYLITAGHCVLPQGIVDNKRDDPFCSAFGWYFDYNLDAAGKANVDHIPANRIYRCKRMVRAENTPAPGPVGANFANDFAVIELDRAVSNDILPLATDANRSHVNAGDLVFAIGHPSGLPAKYSGTSAIADITNPYHFNTYLDTMGGNSGSPIFNRENKVVGILLSGHPIDYYEDPKLKCYRANMCSADGSSCTENSNFKDLPTVTSVQYIDTALKYVRYPQPKKPNRLSKHSQTYRLRAR